MAPDTEIHRALGRMEGKLEGITATLERVDKRSAARDETLQQMDDRLAKLEAQSETTVIVTKEFNALQQAIRDGKMQGKGIAIGIGLAAGAGGATVVTLFKNAWASLFGA